MKINAVKYKVWGIKILLKPKNRYENLVQLQVLSTVKPLQDTD